MSEQQSALAEMLRSTSGDDPSSDNLVKRALEAVRLHLGMQVAYVSEFQGNNSIFREVDAPGLEALIKPGDTASLDDIYCRHILEGRLPQMIPDTSEIPLARDMPITKAANIGSHMSVPLRLPDGSAYGMFCCIGTQANPSLNERDLNMMRAFADLAAFQIKRDLDARRSSDERISRVVRAIEDHQIAMVYQPIWRISDRRPIGVEALARFSATPTRPPNIWFDEAHEAGLGATLELAAIAEAMASLSVLPESAYLSINASPATILTPAFGDVMARAPASRVVLEITEHASVENYTSLIDAPAALRQTGMRVAVDDAGAGYSSLKHILQLKPDFIKLDIGLTRDIDRDPARRAMAAALIAFAHHTGSRIVAEGVETALELDTLGELGADAAQGYYLARPAALDVVAGLF